MKRSPLHLLTHWYTYRTVVGVVVGLAIALLMFGAYATGFFPVHPESRLFPLNDRPDPNVVIIGIDDPTLAADKQFPIPRDRYATVLDQLHAANVATTVFDVQFSEASQNPFADDQLAAAIGRDGLVVLAYGQTDLKYGDGYLTMTNPGTLNRPLDKFLCGNPKAAKGCKPVAELGATAVLLDNDKAVRQVPMFVEAPCTSEDATGSCHAGVINPLSFVAYRQLLLGKDAATVPLTRGADGAQFGSAWRKPLWTDSYGAALVNFSGGAGNYAAHGQYISFRDVLNGNFDRSKVEGKIALVGVYGATGIHDEQQVPPGFPTPMAGVEIQANMIQTLASADQNRFLQPEPPVLVLLTLILIGVLLGVGLPRLSAVWGGGVTFAVAAAYTVLWVPLFGLTNLVPDFLETWLAIGGTYAGLMAYRFLYEEREKRKVKSIFGKYLKPELVQELSARRSLEDVHQEFDRRELSLLFVDIRGFTHMSESMEAADVLRVLNVYLEELTRIVFRWDGTLDKYVGDEIMAIWNAPRFQPDHALRAVRCAWDMVEAMETINAQLAAQQLPSIQFGVGVNSGPATVGMMGSGNRLTYTAIGDTVNTAARFCGAAGPTQILIGQQTYELCRDNLAVDMVPGVQLKGKSAEKFTIYRVTAIREAPGQPWKTVPGLETYAEVGVYHQQTMIGAGATVALESGPLTAPTPSGSAPA